MSSIDRSIDIEPNETKTNEIVQPEINSIHLHKCVNETFQNEKKKRKCHLQIVQSDESSSSSSSDELSSSLDSSTNKIEIQMTNSKVR